MLPKEAIEEYKKLYAKNYGVKLSDKEAIRRANNLVALYTAVYGNTFGRVENHSDRKNENDNENKLCQKTI